MTYIVSPTDPTTPADSDDALQGAEELRALKAYIAGLAGLGTGINLYRKNVLVGGDFSLNPFQSGNNFVAPASGVYVADQFQFGLAGAGALTISQNANAPTIAQAGYFTSHCILMDVTVINAAPGAADNCNLAVSVEGYNFRPLAGKPMTLSFWHAHTKPGIYSIGARNSGSDQSCVFEYTQLIADAWEKATVTFPASPAAGTWDYTNGIGLALFFTLSSGTNNMTGVIGAWQALNRSCSNNQVNALDNVLNNCRFALFQLESGSAATLYEQLSAQETLAFLQRYYEKSYKAGDFPAAVGVEGDAGYMLSVNPPNGAFYGQVQYQTRKRTLTPTIQIFSSNGAANISTNGAGADYAAASCNAGNITDRKFWVSNGSGGALVLVANQLVRHHWTASSRF